MSKPVVILADTDYSYLTTLQLKFVEEKIDEIELEIITDPAYYREYFSTPCHAGILLVSEDLYFSDLHKHNIQHVFMLSEQPVLQGGTENLAVKKVYKYSSVKSIYNEVVSLCPDVFRDAQEHKTTQVIAVSSPMGGAGKTVTALGVAACLAQSYKKVLYLDAEQIQSFQFFLENKGTLPASAMQLLQNLTDQNYHSLSSYFRMEQFGYLPPFPVALDSAGLTLSALLELVKLAKASGEYDFIIVDTDSVFDAFKAALFTMADRVLLVTGQDAYSTFQTGRYLSNFNYKDSDKYMLVCNRYAPDRENVLIQQGVHLTISEYVEHNPAALRDAQALTGLDGFQKIAYMIS